MHEADMAAAQHLHNARMGARQVENDGQNCHVAENLCSQYVGFSLPKSTVWSEMQIVGGSI